MEIRWVGSAYADLVGFPHEPRRDAGFQLSKDQAGLEPEDWKPFDDVGAGAKEIRISDIDQMSSIKTPRQASWRTVDPRTPTPSWAESRYR